jgi:hypothetical protein
MDHFFGLLGFVLLLAVFVLTVDELRKYFPSRWWCVGIPFTLCLGIHAVTGMIPAMKLGRGARRLVAELVFLMLCFVAVKMAKRWKDRTINNKGGQT